MIYEGKIRTFRKAGKPISVISRKNFGANELAVIFAAHEAHFFTYSSSCFLAPGVGC
jgi:hypothetical protein